MADSVVVQPATATIVKPNKPRLLGYTTTNTKAITLYDRARQVATNTKPMLLNERQEPKTIWRVGVGY